MNQISGTHGTFVVNNTTRKAGTFTGILTLEDTVFSKIEVDESTTDVKADYIAATGTAVKAGALIKPVGDSNFSAVTLTSGSVVLIRF